MSKCAVHMMKLKMDAMGGIQSHNQREHESRKNKDIDYEKSKWNFDTVNDEEISYRQAVKDRIAELNLSKSPRKDAVVYCSFIVSSDKEFFERLGEREHINRQREEHEMVALMLQDPVPFEVCEENYRNDCIMNGAKRFFEQATQFFQQRYGEENVINGTVHMDEHTPHMHLGVVPVTTDGRLSAKDIFNPLELKQLQTDFAEKVGARFNLVRGVEGSQSKHLDELAFKTQKRTEELEKLDREYMDLKREKWKLEDNCKDLQKEAESLTETIKELKAEVSTLDTLKRRIEQTVAVLQEKLLDVKQAIENTFRTAERGGMTREKIERMLESRKMSDFIQQTGQEERFKTFCRTPQRNKNSKGHDEPER